MLSKFGQRGIQIRILMLLASVQVFSLMALANCPGSLPANYPRFRWQQVDWNYSGAEADTGVTNAMNDWNNATGQQYYVIGHTPGFTNEVVISDNADLTDVNGNPALGLTTHTPIGPPWICYLHVDTIFGFCYGSSMMMQPTIQINPTLITQTVNDYMAYGMTRDPVVEKTIAHEMGHVFHLENDDTAINCSVPSIMNTQGGPYQCPTLQNSFNGPQNCDVQQFLTDMQNWATFDWYMGTGCNQNVNCQ